MAAQVATLAMAAPDETGTTFLENATIKALEDSELVLVDAA